MCGGVGRVICEFNKNQQDIIGVARPQPGRFGLSLAASSRSACILGFISSVARFVASGIGTPRRSYHSGGAGGITARAVRLNVNTATSIGIRILEVHLMAYLPL